MMKIHSSVVIFYLFYINITAIYTKKVLNIAVIGGGIGGTSSAYFLRELFGDDVKVDLYEAKEIGGRLATIELGDRIYESGGTIIHPDNFYMVNFTKMLGLEPRAGAGGRLGMYDGKEMFFTGSEWDVMLMAQFLWRYGLDMYRILNYVKDMLNHFNNIYENQDKGYAFTSVEKLLDSMSPDFIGKLHHSCAEDLKQYGFGELFINELAQAALRTNYGQANNIQAFVGSVSLAGVMPGLWKVKGGNKQVPEGLLKASAATLIKSKVNSVTKLQNGYEIGCHDQNGYWNKKYEIVVVAAPLSHNMSKINFIDFQKPVWQHSENYHRTVATFVMGWPNISNFGFENFNDFPTEILTTNDNVFFNSIGRQTAIDFQPGLEPQFKEAPVWKVFSQEDLTDLQIGYLFSSVKEKKVVDWLAYPHYASDEKDIPPFKLDENLYYVSAIEYAASAMEMEVIGAKNAALLAFNEWYGHLNKIDNMLTPNTDRTEL